jgi:hypothetical protein
MRLLLFLLVSTVIIGLFLYSKLLPYKDRLNLRYKKIFDFFNNLFTPILNFLKGFMKPFNVGQGLAVDMTQILLLVILLLILKFV